MKITIEDKTFTSVDALKKYTRDLLSSVGFCKSVKSKNMDVYDFLLELSQRHPHFKLDSRVDFQIVPNPYNSKLMQLEIVNEDDTTEVISWVVCCRGYNYNYKDNCRIKFVTE